MFIENSISNSAVLLDPRMNQRAQNTTQQNIQQQRKNTTYKIQQKSETNALLY